MLVTEYAEKIVLGASLEEKLTPPGKLSFDSFAKRKPAAAIRAAESLATPGRPSGLKMHDGPGLSQPPADSELKTEHARGRLLHFLANHELLATELMALVLLKFPEAPLEFQRGVLVTLQEEQMHTKLYLKRMRECGIELGSYPLSGHFWRVVEPMKDPIDFVSRLSLTFEQANLDYSLHYAGIFRELGDVETAKILERVYQDEIGHVQHGLKWFRQWKNPSQSDWEAFESQLDFPMSPQRARGPKCEFNRRGRQQAGLDEQFIDAVEVYRQSRGRPPIVRWFEPSTEDRLSGDVSAQNSSLAKQLHHDLDSLMLFLSQEDDVVLVREVPSNQFRKYLLQAGVTLPEFVAWDDRESLVVRKLEALEPWAWTPAIRDDVATLETQTSRQTTWNASQLDLFRKSWASNCLHEWTTEDSAPDWCVPSNMTATQVANIGDVESACAAFQRLGYHRLLFKREFGTSGRGQRQLDATNISAEDRNWLKSSLDTQPGVVEPELERIVDISFLFRMSREFPGKNGTLEFLGWTRQHISPGRRRYSGTYLRKPFAGCPQEVKRFLLADDCRILHETKNWLMEHLEPELLKRDFSGLCGVDALVCRTDFGLQVKPVVEFNPRCTMGHIALRLERHLAATARGVFLLLRKGEYATWSERKHEAPLGLSSDGRWVSGSVRLSEPSNASVLVPVVVVGESQRQKILSSMR